jgi:DNA repair protein RecO (recombination protein O)
VLHKTRGVVFRFTKYGDSSIIVTIFTAEFGLQSYIVNGVRSKSTRSKIALYQPLTLLDLVVYYKENQPIKRIKEIRCIHPYQTIPVDIRKSTLALFISEVLNRVVKEESHTEELCEFIITSLVTLDTLSENIETFHLAFLLKLSRFLGFGAGNANEVLGWRITDSAIENALANLIQSDYGDNVPMTNEHRRELLSLLIAFYNDHTQMLGEMKSVQVLREILS